jgi:hypothetical protein
MLGPYRNLQPVDHEQFVYKVFQSGFRGSKMAVGGYRIAGMILNSSKRARHIDVDIRTLPLNCPGGVYQSHVKQTLGVPLRQALI